MTHSDDELIALIANRTGMQRQSARVLCILWQAKGRIITQTGMAERLFDLSSDRATLAGISASIKRARRALDGLPVSIVTFTGIGWKAVCTDPAFDWQEPRNEP